MLLPFIPPAVTAPDRTSSCDDLRHGIACIFDVSMPERE